MYIFIEMFTRKIESMLRNETEKEEVKQVQMRLSLRVLSHACEQEDFFLVGTI